MIPFFELKHKRQFIAVAIVLVLAIFTMGAATAWRVYEGHSQLPVSEDHSTPSVPTASAQVTAPSEPVVPKVSHIQTPAQVRGIYVTSWVASIPEWRNRLVKLIDASELNAVIIDVKDYSGYVSLDTQDPIIKSMGVEQIRAKDLKEWIEELHRHQIYVIARITVFQDPLYAKLHPDQAVQTRAGAVWQDRNGLAFVDPSAKPFWDYIVRIGKASEKAGFDELNFDYIRFPTDGNLANMSFPLSGPTVLAADRRLGPSVTESIRTMSPREKVLDGFYAYLNQQLQEVGIPISADIFGMTTHNYDDLGIGQVLETVARHFDYVCPMVYPSHYPPHFAGYAHPAAYPYEIVYLAMTRGVSRLEAAGMSKSKLRPWIQDFNMGATYDAAKVKAQQKAVFDSGLTSFLVWDPANKYTSKAY